MASPSLFSLLFSCALIMSLPHQTSTVMASRVSRHLLSSSPEILGDQQKNAAELAPAPAPTPTGIPKLSIPPLPQLGNGNANGNLPKLNLPPVSLPKPQNGNGMGGTNLPKLNLPPVSLPKAQQIPSSVPPLPSVSLPKPSGILPPLPSIPGGFQIPSIPFLTSPPPSTQQSTP